MTELNKLWQNADHKINDETALSMDNLSSNQRRKLQGKLYKIPLNHLFNIIVDLPFTLFLMDFIKMHFTDTYFMIPAAVLLLVVAFSLALSIYALSEYLRIRVDKNIIETQKRLSSLSILEKWETRSLLVLIPLFAGPFLIVFAKSFIGLDLYSLAGQWLPEFLGGSFIVAIILVFFLSKFPNPELKAARKSLQELNQFK